MAPEFTARRLRLEAIARKVVAAQRGIVLGESSEGQVAVNAPCHDAWQVWLHMTITPGISESYAEASRTADVPRDWHGVATIGTQLERGQATEDAWDAVAEMNILDAIALMRRRAAGQLGCGDHVTIDGYRYEIVAHHVVDSQRSPGGTGETFTLQRLP